MKPQGEKQEHQGSGGGNCILPSGHQGPCKEGYAREKQEGLPELPDRIWVERPESVGGIRFNAWKTPNEDESEGVWYVPRERLILVETVLKERNREAILAAENYDRINGLRNEAVERAEKAEAALRKTQGFLIAHVKRLHGPKSLACIHDYEPDICMTEMRCNLCGVDANIGAALAAVSPVVKEKE